MLPSETPLGHPARHQRPLASFRRTLLCGWIMVVTTSTAIGLIALLSAAPASPPSDVSEPGSAVEMPAPPGPAGAAFTAAAAAPPSDALTLEQLKQTGWDRSRYRELLAAGTTELSDRWTLSEPPRPRLDEYADLLQPVLHAACLDCHGPDAQEGNFRLDTLDPNLLAGNDVMWWSEVLAVLSKGEMPPPDAMPLEDADRQRIVDWLADQLHVAAMVRRGSEPATSFRRLTRYEFNYALQDLLGLPWDFARDLPPEATSADGFQNSAPLLQMSVSQLELYHRLAQRALSRVIRVGPRPATLHWSVSMSQASRLEWPKLEKRVADEREKFKDSPGELAEALLALEESFRQPHGRTYFLDTATGRTAVAAWEYYGARYAHEPQEEPPQPPPTVQQVAILPAGGWLNIELGNRLPDEGTLRVRVRAARHDPLTQPVPSLQLHFGWQASNEGRALVRVSSHDLPIEALPDEPAYYQFCVPLGEIYPRNSVRTTSPMGAMPSPSEYVRLVNSSASSADMWIDYVEVEAPVYESWPPPEHRRLLEPAAGIEEPTEAARRILADFMPRAWRRPVTSAEIDQKLALFVRIWNQCEVFEEAMAEVLATVLASPHFLYLVQASETELNDYELAARLAMFLWCSQPDEELRSLAAEGRLQDPVVWSDQVQRMLADGRSQRLAEHFVHQWLGMDLLEHLNAGERGRLDPLLKAAMQQEPVAMFAEMIRENESVLNFIHSDFTLVNERLARHYGLSGVSGNAFRRVSLGGDVRRGGLLTQAGLLTMNSDYPDSHPLKRGKWLLESLLNDPPPPPPPAVPEIDLADPEIAKMSLKERIEDHRNHAACMSCHIKIDPWGIAFENYDALGRWREEVNGQPVDASSRLANQQMLAGMDGLKRLLLEQRQDQFVAALVHKLLTYALGRPLSFADRADVELIAARVRQQGDGLATLIEAIVTSDRFRMR